MSTRATIKLSDGSETYYIYRHCDGYPECIMADIKKVINISKDRWSYANFGQFISLFLGTFFNPKHSVQDYEITDCFHGDESHRYSITWNDITDTYFVEEII